ncbi:MAG: hypothetical protein SFV15_22285 [Polyangiaceae bacterium]|nr:hypothetical protein [Polyangiaceae bacterium]
MTAKNLPDVNSSEFTDPEVLGALAALRRARKRAEEIATATGTALVQQIDGKLVLVYPKPAVNRVPDETSADSGVDNAKRIPR